MVQVQKKLILFLGQPEGEFVSNIQSSLQKALSPSAVMPQFVWARDGADADFKLNNQKFHALVIDTQASRLREGKFLTDVRKACSSGKIDLIAIVPDSTSKLPQELEVASQVVNKPYDVDILVRALAKALSTESRVEAPPAANKSAFAVDVRVINSLLKSTIFICQQYGISHVDMQKPQVREPNGSWNGDIAATIDIKSKLFQGALVISFDKRVYLKVYATMLGEEHPDLNAENSEAIGEIANMILGNAKAEITSYDVGMSIPRALKFGESNRYPPGSASIRLIGSCDVGNIYLDVIAYKTEVKAAA